MKLVKAIGDSIHPSIKLEIDYPSQNEDRKLKILDLKVWLEDIGERRVIMYEHYTKEVRTKAVINAQSAMPNNMKRTILSQEILRIITHCCRDLPESTRNGHINEALRRIQYSGYDKTFRYDVVNSALKAYETLLEKERQGERPLHRPKDWNRIERRQEREDRKTNWYKKGNEESVIFVPYTQNSELKKRYVEQIQKSGIRIKVVERPGRTLKSLIQKPDPFKEKRCGRKDCFVCESGGKGDCMVENINYEIVCEQECKKKDVYIGESSNNGYTRGRKHLELMKSKHRDSILWRHCVEQHEGIRKGFKMNVTGRFGSDSMSRQITEGVKIENMEDGRLMNERSEWNMTRISKMRIM